MRFDTKEQRKHLIDTCTDWLAMGDSYTVKEQLAMLQVIQTEILIEQNERILAMLEVLKRVGISEVNNQTNIARDMAQNWSDFLVGERRKR
jgi:hypothetical protein